MVPSPKAVPERVREVVAVWKVGGALVTAAGVSMQFARAEFLFASKPLH